MPEMPTPATPPTVTLIPGDGIGPEVIGAARRVLDAAGARIAWEERHAGSRIFKQGLASGVPAETIDSIARSRVVLKGPLETPVGHGEKSANVTLRKLFETYANIRPVREMPGVLTPFSGRGIDLVVVRENVEDLYAGIEYMQTPGAAQALKVTTRKGCEKIVRYAFELARAEGRQRVQCATKANILKFTEGMLKRTFEEIAPEYGDIAASHIIVDNCAHQLVRAPERFDVIVTTNMNGDILSDLTSGLIGGLGFAPGANLGRQVAIFEAVHGSAPDIAGKDIANPTAVLLSSVMMLRHLGDFSTARTVEQAVVATLEQGTLTRDAAPPGAVGTSAFADAVIRNLGVDSRSYASRNHQPIRRPLVSPAPDLVRATRRRVVGVDLFIESALGTDVLGPALAALAGGTALMLKVISNRGTQVWPSLGTLADPVDHYRCRFMVRDPDTDLTDDALLALLDRVRASHRWMHLEKLQEFDGVPGYTRAQGED